MKREDCRIGLPVTTAHKAPFLPPGAMGFPDGVDMVGDNFGFVCALQRDRALVEFVYSDLEGFEDGPPGWLPFERLAAWERPPNDDNLPHTGHWDRSCNVLRAVDTTIAELDPGQLIWVGDNLLARVDTVSRRGGDEWFINSTATWPERGRNGEVWHHGWHPADYPMRRAP
jgi:hypothetical protein